MTDSPPVPRADARGGEFTSIACPFERVQAINAIVRRNCTLPGDLARMRLTALIEGRQLTDTVTELADRVRMGRSRVSTLLNTTGR